MSDLFKKLSDFITELRRRRVFRVTAVYAGMTFVVIQIIDGAFSYLHIPEIYGTGIIIVLLIGFPVAIALAWVFDITDKGVVRTKKGWGFSKKKGKKPLTSNISLILIGIAVLIFGLFFRTGLDNSPPSVAVLPFTNMSNDPDQEYFSDGISEEIINHLAQISGLQVAGRTSSFSFRSENKDLISIGKSLGVTHLLEGSVRHSGDKVRITAQLIESGSGFHVWSESYERPLKDIFTIQDEISNSIALALKLNLLPDNEKKSIVNFEPSQKSYNAFLLGQFHLAKRTQSEIWQAVINFREAVKLDPEFARAQAALSQSLILYWLYSPAAESNPEFSIAEAFNSAKKSLTLESNLPEGHMALGTYYLIQTQDYNKAHEHLAEAYNLAPDNPEIINFYGDYFVYLMDWDKALEIESIAEERDPLSLPNKTDLAVVYSSLGEHDKSLRLAEEALNLDSQYIPGQHFKATMLYIANRPEELKKQIDLLLNLGESDIANFYKALAGILTDMPSDSLNELTKVVYKGMLDGKIPTNNLAFLYNEQNNMDSLAVWFSPKPDLGHGVLMKTKMILSILASSHPKALEILNREDVKIYLRAQKGIKIPKL